MYITDLTAHGFKGRNSILHRLGKINVVIGRNAKGKTAILQLIRTLLFGYDPILGIRALGKLMSSQAPNATCLFDNGKGITRRWTRTKTGGATEQNPPDSVIAVPQVLLDFKTFLEKSGPQQLAYVITQTDLTALGYTPAQMVADVKNVRPEQSSEETEAALTAVVAELDKVSAQQASEGFNVNVWLERAVSALKEKLKLDNAEVKRLTAAIQTQVSQQAASDKVARQRPVIEREIEALREEMRRLQSENAVRVEQLRTYGEKRKQQEQLKDMLALPDCSQRIAQLVERMAALDVFRARPMQAPALQDKLRQASNALTAARGVYLRSFQDVERINCEISDNETKECCPSCGYAGEEFRAFVKKNLQAKLAEATAAKSTAAQNESVALKAFELIEATHKDAKAFDDATRNAQGDWDELNEELTRLRHNQTLRDTAQAKLEAIQLGEPPDEAATEAASDRIAKITSAGLALKQELNIAISQQAEKLARETTKAEKIKAEAKAEVTKLALKALETKQEEIVSESMKSLLRVASRFTDGIIDGALAWNDELGVWRGGQWVSHEVFSDMEQALAFVGLSVALAASSPFKVVLLDRLECVDNDNIELFMSRIMEMVQDGTIHQFVAVDVNAKRWNQSNPDVTILEV